MQHLRTLTYERWKVKTTFPLMVQRNIIFHILLEAQPYYRSQDLGHHCCCNLIGGRTDIVSVMLLNSISQVEL